MKTNKNAPYFLLHKFSEEEKDKIKKKYMIYGDESKILVDKHGRPCVRYDTEEDPEYPHRIKGVLSGYSYFPIRKEYVYGNEKAYNRE